MALRIISINISRRDDRTHYDPVLYLSFWQLKFLEKKNIGLICVECSNDRIKGEHFSLYSRLKMFNLHCTNDRLNLHTLMSRLRLQHFETFSRGLVFLETFPILVLFSLCFPSSFTYFDQHKDRCLLTGSGLQLWNIALFLFFVYSYIFVHLTFFRTFDFELNLILDGNIQNILSLDCSGSYLGLSTTGSYITQHLLFS